MRVMQFVFRLMLYPFSLIYGMIVVGRDLLYETGLLKSASYDIPLLAVGNLSVGGCGKTPLVEYLIRMLSPHYRLAVLSRGYKRKTKGYRLLSVYDEPQQAGDEPLLLKRKYPFAEVAVAENRMLAIPNILADRPEIQVILMDDAFQHRSVVPSLSILLTTYGRPYFSDHLLPVGRLREFPSAAVRADFIVVTKCPSTLSIEQRQYFLNKISPETHQQVFFSYLHYRGYVYDILNPLQRKVLGKEMDVYCFCGIAVVDELEAYLQSATRNYWLRDFPDHHYYDRYDMENIITSYENIPSDNKILVTTEKDAVRLKEHITWLIQKKISIFVLPVEVRFFQEDKQIFEQEILRYLASVIPDGQGRHLASR